MTAPNWTTRDRWRDVRLGVGIGIVLACTAMAYSPRLTSALHALGSPRPALTSAPVLASDGPTMMLTLEEQDSLERMLAVVERMRLPVTISATAAPAHTDQIGDLIAANR